METFIIGNKEITLVKTAHVSKQSIQEVADTIDMIIPDTVCIELDDKRAQGLFKTTDYSSMKLSDVIKQKKVILVVVNYILSSYQKKLADQMDTNVGDEMRMGVTKAQEIGASIAYIDRDIQTTFKRIWSHLSFWGKAKLLVSFVLSAFDEQEVEEDQIEELKNADILEDALTEISNEYPEIAEVLIFERDAYMAQSIKEAPGKKIVVVIGAAHAPGIIKHLQEPEIDKTLLETIKKPSWISKNIGWLLIVSVILMVFVTTGFNIDGLLRISGWLLAAGAAAALGALICLAHPVTILVSFLAAPISTLSPILAVGWFAGLTESYFRRATVQDFNTLSTDKNSLRKALKNNILRTLLIMIMTSLFSSIVTILFSFDVVRTFILSLF